LKLQGASISIVSKRQEGILGGFTKKCGVKRLVYYEVYGDAKRATAGEKRIKKWRSYVCP